MMDTMNEWLKFAPTAPELAEGKTWHVFLSYRSVHRPWILQLYDILRQLGFEVFLDQYVLRANDNLVLALQRGLDESASGILVWSSRTEDSKWCQEEFATMKQKELGGDFRFGVAKLDSADLPALAAGKLYADFSDYSEGPLGTGLLRLLYGIVGNPLPDLAVRFGTAVDDEVRVATAAIRAAVDTENKARLLELAATDSVAWRSTPVLSCQVVEGLIEFGANDEALQVLKAVQQDFPRALRPRQLQGLALARAGKTEQAQLVLGELEAAGNRDPETLGIYARTWMDRYKATGDRRFLRKSRNLYQLAFEHTPSDSYVGINAASKSVILGELDVAKRIAEQVERLFDPKSPPSDYWKAVTLAEISLIRQDYDIAVERYQRAVDDAPSKRESHRSTRDQARLLMDHLKSPSEMRRRIEAIFAHLEVSAAAMGGPTLDKPVSI